METTNTSRADRVQANLNFTCQAIKDNKAQSTETSLAIIAQCQIDISYTLASILDEMRENKVKSIPLDKVKQAIEKIGDLPAEYSTLIDGKKVLSILDKLVESEG